MIPTKRPEIDPADMRRLAEAIARLGNDPRFFVEALTEKLLSMRPVSTQTEIIGPERHFLIASGTFTEHELEDAEAEVRRGTLQLADIQTWMHSLADTLSRNETSRFLTITEDELREAVERRELMAVPAAGRLRFPRWQFDARQPDRRLPGLQALIARMPDAPDLAWASFMNTPQQELIWFGPQTPRQWLQNGGSIADVLELVDDDEW